MSRSRFVVLFFFLFGLRTAPAQQFIPLFGTDPCGYPDTTNVFYKTAAAANWGYGYDLLLSDIGRWKLSPYVRVDSMGASVQSRTLHLLTIEDTAFTAAPRKRIWIHARTHPNEVQGTWVTNEIIRFLLSESDTARILRSRCVFNILPMLNPDGVELGIGYDRNNANGIDIESNWAVVPGEVEVQALRRKFQEFMAGPNPIQVALNMHSAFACRRYFVYHAAGGTSTLFASLEQQYIGLVRGYFPGGIQDWPYFVSWASTAPTVYPESWFWYNHREAVMALTYEDMNCPAATAFDSTAWALLKGSADYLGILTSVLAEESGRRPLQPILFQNYPNPFNPSTTVRFSVPAEAFTSVAIFDLLGRRVALLVDEEKKQGIHTVVWDPSAEAGGVYFCRLQSGTYVEMRRMLLLR